MKKMIISFFASLLIVVGVIACTEKKAEAAPYVEVGLGSTLYDYSGSVGTIFDDNAIGFSVLVGHAVPIVPWLSAEFEYTDFGEATQTVFGVDTGFDVEAFTLWAVGDWTPWAIAGMPLGVSARLGFTNADADANVGPVTFTSNDTGMAYGAGLKLWFQPMTAATLEYTKRDLDFTVGSASFEYDPGMIKLAVHHQF